MKSGKGKTNNHNKNILIKKIVKKIKNIGCANKRKFFYEGEYMKIVMFYEVAADGLSKITPCIDAGHRSRIREFHQRGDLIMIGPYSNPQDGALGIFKNKEAAEEFIRDDTYVVNGVVEKWRLVEWNEILT